MLSISSFIAKRTGQETVDMILDGGLYEQMLSIVRRMAFSPLKQECEYGAIPACLYCSWTSHALYEQARRTSTDFDKLLSAPEGVQHDPDCPILQAEQVLVEVQRR